MLTVTQRPSKSILNDGVSYFTSKWNAAHLPIVYKLLSNFFPTNNSDSIDCFTSVLDSNGFARLELCVNYEDYQELNYITITGSNYYNGTWQIKDYIDGNSLVIEAPFQGTDTGSLQKHYNNYHALIRVYGGLPSTHPLNASKPFELLATLKIIPDTNNIVSVNINKILLEMLSCKDDYAYSNTIEVDLNAFTGFYIQYAESYDSVLDGEVVTHTTAYTSDISNVFWAVNGAMPFQSTYGGNMGEYVSNFNNDSVPAKFLTDAEELEQKNGVDFDLSAIIDSDAWDASDAIWFSANTYGENNILADQFRFQITDRKDGVYRLKDTIHNEYEDDVTKIKYRIYSIPGNIFTAADDGTFEDTADPSGNPPSDWDITLGTNVSLTQSAGSAYSGSDKGAVSYTGPELVTNGDFSSSAGWTVGANWSIGAGVATHTGPLGVGSTSRLSRSQALISGNSYIITFTVTGYTLVGGTSRLGTNIDTNLIPITGNGSYSLEVTIGSTTNELRVTGADTFTVDNISIKQLFQPTTSLIFESGSDMAVDANMDYVAEAYVYFPTAIGTTSTTGGIYLLATGSNPIGSYTAQSANGSRFFLILDGQVARSVTSATGEWIKITTTFNTGSNTAVKLGGYLFGTLASYGLPLDFYIDQITLKGPIKYLTDELTSSVDQTCSNQDLTLRWLNQKGGWEQFTFTGKRDYILDVENEILTKRDILSDWDTDYINETTEDDIVSKEAHEGELVRSQYVPKAYLNKVLKTILLSPKVYKVQDTKLITVIVESGTFKLYTDGDRLYSIEFNIRYTNKIRNQEQ